MNVIYIHGLDSDANSTKGRLLEDYCHKYHSDIKVLRPDLNKRPDQVFKQIVSSIEGLKVHNTIKNEQCEPSNTVLIGSSLGGYFSTLISNHTGCPALLLNPSIQPHITLQRFAEDSTLTNNVKEEGLSNQVIHSTVGGWDITNVDLQWFEKHQLSTIHYPNKVTVLIKDGDELLDSQLSAEFYRQQGARVVLQAGGNHRFSDFAEHLPMVIETLRQLQ
ncbi:YqiA/YcfP family alpha/beta fold hydrolase [Psychrobacter sp. GP33]|uniref:YqiA/YcfP family alpha/beta fold hydrolase n=1 Tax=Psychrobacter sp. GP33 TaxID=2758709 RepID=UPI0015F7C48C|nr:YqiA/YcfP family alpha/beta fold hydrolase [Psychrobacter sp. GP33]